MSECLVRAALRGRLRVFWGCSSGNLANGARDRENLQSTLLCMCTGASEAAPPCRHVAASRPPTELPRAHLEVLHQLAQQRKRLGRERVDARPRVSAAAAALQRAPARVPGRLQARRAAVRGLGAAVAAPAAGQAMRQLRGRCRPGIQVLRRRRRRALRGEAGRAAAVRRARGWERCWRRATCMGDSLP